jgi:SOS-response transcriptional repressor LexA
MQPLLSDFSSIALRAPLFDTSNMAESDENPPILAELLRFKPPHWSPNRWAVEAGVSRTVWADIRKHGNPSRRTLDKLLAAAGSSVAEFEALRADVPVRTEVVGTGMGTKDVERAWRGAPMQKPVPLLGSAIGGGWSDLEEAVELTELHLSEVLDYLARPPSVSGDPQAYAVTIVGDSMAPRFEPGERAYVSPRAAAAIGDDVIVQLVGNGGGDEEGRVAMVLIKRLVRRTAKEIELRQFNPDLTFRVPAAKVAAIHKVVGRL